MPVEHHLVRGTFRKDRHDPHHVKRYKTPSKPKPQAALPDTSPASALSGNALALALAGMPDEVQAWVDFLAYGDDTLRQLPDDLDEAKARRMARRMWARLGPVLVKFWGEARARESWAWKKFGVVTHHVHCAPHAN